MLLAIWSAVGWWVKLLPEVLWGCYFFCNVRAILVEMYIQLPGGGYMGQQLLYQLHPWRASLHELPFRGQIVTPNLISGLHAGNSRWNTQLLFEGVSSCRGSSIFTGHVEFQGGLPSLHFFLMHNPKKKSNQGFDSNLPLGIYQLWHRMINFISIYDVISLYAMLLSKMHLLNNFLIGMFSICTLLCIILFSWLALISWHVFVPYINLYLIWSHLIWSHLILDLPILLGYFICQSTDCTSWTSENMSLSLPITLDIPHPLPFLGKTDASKYQ